MLHLAGEDLDLEAALFRPCSSFAGHALPSERTQPLLSHVCAAVFDDAYCSAYGQSGALCVMWSVDFARITGGRL